METYWKAKLEKAEKILYESNQEVLTPHLIYDVLYKLRASVAQLVNRQPFYACSRHTPHSCVTNHICTKTYSSYS